MSVKTQSYEYSMNFAENLADQRRDQAGKKKLKERKGDGYSIGKGFEAN